MQKITQTIVILLCLVLFTACGSRVDNHRVQKYVTEAESVIKLINEGDYEGVYERFNAEMKYTLPAMDMAQELTPIVEASGDYEGIDKANVDERDGYFVTVIIARYSEENRVYTITFNSQDEIAGLYIK